MAYYKEFETIIDGAISIYTTESSSRRWWYCYLKVKGQKRIRKSLRTTSKSEAIRLAKEHYNRLSALESQGLPIHATSFNHLLKMYQASKCYGETTRHRLKWLSYYFGNYTDIKEIDTPSITRWAKWRATFWTSKEGQKYIKDHAITGGRQIHSDIKPRTLKMEAVALKGVLSWAKEKGLIGHLPDIKPLTVMRQYRQNNQHRRAAFTMDNHRMILRYLDLDYKRMKKARNTRGTTMEIHSRSNKSPYMSVNILKNRRMWCWVHLLRHSGIRCSEALRLRWKHWAQMEDEEHKLVITKIRIDEEVSKVSMLRDVLVVDTSLVRNQKSHLASVLEHWRSITPCSNEDDFIFSDVGTHRSPDQHLKDKGSNMDQYFSKMIKNRFAKAPDTWHITPLINDGAQPPKEYTSTSYRHMYCTESIGKGISTSLIANQMGTSELQIRQTYSHLFSWQYRDKLIDAAIKHDELQRKKHERKKVIEIAKFL